MHWHVLFVAEDATADDAVAWACLGRLAAGLEVCDASRAAERVRRQVPDLVVWAGPALEPGGLRELRFDPATWNVPVLQLHRGDEAGLRVEPDVSLCRPSEVELVGAARRAIAERDARLKGGVRAELRLSLPSDLGELDRLGSLMADWLGLCGLRPAQARHTTRAVREVAANAIEWGHRQQRERRVELCAWLEEDRAGVLVRDSGPGFDRRDLPHAARHGDSQSHLDVRAALNLRQGGFGILHATGLVDHLCYNEKGNEGLIVKYLPRLPAGLDHAGAMAS